LLLLLLLEIRGRWKRYCWCVC